MIIDMDQAKSRLSKLVAAAEAGDEVIIARNGKPAARLVALNMSRFRFGALAHLASVVPDFEDDLDDGELSLWERDT